MLNLRKSSYVKFLSFTLFFVLIFSITSFAGDGNTGPLPQNLSFLTLVPPLVAITLAFLTKNVVISLFIGAMSGTYLVALTHDNFISAIVTAFLDFITKALNALADPWNAGIVLQVLAIGGVVHLISKMGGAKAVAEKLVSKAKSPVSAQIITWILGILVFFDDYANSLIVGPIMRPVYDNMKISREKLAFIVDATAAPIAGIAIISTWIGFEIGTIQDAFSIINIDVDGFSIFLQTIPYRFYIIFMLLFVVIVSVSLRDFGAMEKAQERTNSGDLGEDVDVLAEEILLKEGLTPKIRNAVIPILSLVIAALLSFYFSGYNAIISGEDVDLVNTITASPFSIIAIRECFGASDASVALFQSAVFAGIVAMVMGVSQKIFTVSEAVDTWINGMKTLLITGVILILAWSLSSVIKELGTASYIVSLLSESIPVFILPSLIFILGAVISFATGTSYGTMSILMPLAVPIGMAINPEMSYAILCTSAVLTGAIFGDHCSPISDTTILSSMGSGCNHISHVKTQMPYALFVAGVTIIFGYLPAGFGISPYIIIPVGFAIMVGIMLVFGKKSFITGNKVKK